jgi:hypothetical protein
MLCVVAVATTEVHATGSGRLLIPVNFYVCRGYDGFFRECRFLDYEVFASYPRMMKKRQLPKTLPASFVPAEEC